MNDKINNNEPQAFIKPKSALQDDEEVVEQIIADQNLQAKADSIRFEEDDSWPNFEEEAKAITKWPFSTKMQKATLNLGLETLTGLKFTQLSIELKFHDGETLGKKINALVNALKTHCKTEQQPIRAQSKQDLTNLPYANKTEQSKPAEEIVMYPEVTESSIAGVNCPHCATLLRRFRKPPEMRMNKFTKTMKPFQVDWLKCLLPTCSFRTNIVLNPEGKAFHAFTNKYLKAIGKPELIRTK